jgi:hypothetical protein
MFAALEGADYQCESSFLISLLLSCLLLIAFPFHLVAAYIISYVWNSEPYTFSIFFETQEVAYNALLPPPSPSPTFFGATNAPTRSAATVVVDSCVLSYRFFPEISPRAPTGEEIDGVVLETTRFYTDILFQAFQNFDTFEATVLGVEFLPNNYFPVIINFKAIALFSPGKILVLTCKNYECIILDINHVSLFLPKKQEAHSQRQGNYLVS